MRNILTAMLTALLMCGVSLAQTTTPSSPDPSASHEAEPQSQAQPQERPAQRPAQPATAGPALSPPNTPRIAPGSVIPVQLTKTIDAKKVKTGDEIVAKVTQDMKTNTGKVLVPKDTKVVGHVTEAQARSKEQKESMVGIAFDHAVMKSGDVQLPMSIQAIVGPQNENPNAPAANNAPYPGQAGSPGSAPSSGGSERTPGMGGSTTPQAPESGMPSATPTATQNSPQITAQTQGVIGMSHVNLSPGASGTQGSVVSSDKNNVKLESGTLLLLKVNK